MYLMNSVVSTAERFEFSGSQTIGRLDMLILSITGGGTSRGRS